MIGLNNLWNLEQNRVSKSLSVNLIMLFNFRWFSHQQLHISSWLTVTFRGNLILNPSSIRKVCLMRYHQFPCHIAGTGGQLLMTVEYRSKWAAVRTRLCNHSIVWPITSIGQPQERYLKNSLSSRALHPWQPAQQPYPKINGRALSIGSILSMIQVVF